MIKKNSKYNDEECEIEYLTKKQEKVQFSDIEYSHKQRIPPLDRWRDITIGQLRTLIINKQLTFDELVAYLFIEIFQMSFNSLSEKLKAVVKCRDALGKRYDSSKEKIQKLCVNDLNKLMTKRKLNTVPKKTMTVSGEVKEIFEDWKKYSKDYENFVDNNYRRRNESGEINNDY